MSDNIDPALGSLLSDLLKDVKQKNKFLNYINRLLFKRTKYEFARFIQPDDILSSIILKLLAGDIIWHKEKCTLNSFIYFRIRSEIFNLVKKEKKCIPISLNIFDPLDEDCEEHGNGVPLSAELIVDPFKDELGDDEISPEDFKNIVFGIFQDSLEEYCVLDEIYNGRSPRQIAAILGIPENDVYNINRRILRVIKDWLARNKNRKCNSFKSSPKTNTNSNKIMEVPNASGIN
jgi:DNA-directed RNA polymerase specialized sigma24 family protein